MIRDMECSGDRPLLALMMADTAASLHGTPLDCCPAHRTSADDDAPSRDVSRLPGEDRATVGAVCSPASAAAHLFDGAACQRGGRGKKAAPSFQGVFNDPKHPNGYRILVSDAGNRGNKGTMTLQDEPDGNVYIIPITYEANKKTGQTCPL